MTVLRRSAYLATADAALDIDAETRPSNVGFLLVSWANSRLPVMAGVLFSRSLYA